jgi:hypothetical protein
MDELARRISERLEIMRQENIRRASMPFMPARLDRPECDMSTPPYSYIYLDDPPETESLVEHNG